MGVCDLPCLKTYSILLGCVLMLASVSGIGLCLFMLFGEPYARQTYDTYTPNWENIVPASLASIISLLANVCLIGGAKQYSKDIILFWIVWKFLLLILFWVWYAYSMLKFNGYVYWDGMRQCLWCLLPEAETVGFGGAMASLLLFTLMVPVEMFHLKLKRQHRELTEYELAPIVYNPNNYKY
eukprot:TRINITY_DN9239_c0_g1_i1.p1 TRINITY_DN9239_c0_g1~~TRINITY_DN9239_c0_g1_i1.p1  ORF type:complete len:182 (-),score=27.41 TRINITY_DN9239_c0_g1_i1:434-979(-)